ncbi:MAG: hypothetical protein WCD70_16295 [Alphaproteobacteria bacterium]
MTSKDSLSSIPDPERTRLNFADAVARRFSAFLTDFGFLLIESSPTIVRYRKNDLEIDVYHGRSSYELGFGVTRNGVRYSLGELIRATDPKAAEQYKNYAATAQSALNEGLDILAKEVQLYAANALRDDPKFFVTLESQRHLWAEKYALEVLERQLKPKAEEAFRQGRYREAYELYERIKSRLTPTELKKLNIAKVRARDGAA